MESEKVKAEKVRTLRWYAEMDIDADLSPKGKVEIKIQQHSQLQNNFPTYVQTPISSQSDKILGADKMNEKEVLNSNITLSTLRQMVSDFEGCELKGAATNTVFADGAPSSKIMLIGEAPGATEDAKGIPFCGESGKLLDNMIASIGLSREKNVYITNTIFWRPPGNRAPTDLEIEACRPFVEQHIALINPDLLILVGSTAVTSLLGKHLQISKIRQEYYQYTNKYLNRSITTTALFHPAYLLRQPMQKKTTWYDLLKIKEFISKNIKENVF